MPRFTTKGGCTFEYWLRGKGPLLTLTPGGRESGQRVATLAEMLSERATVLTWDRRNGGGADVFFGGEGSEQEIWADDLADLIKHVGGGPAWIVGGSAGCRVSVITTIRHPDAARGLILWSASGGPYGCQVLGFNYHVPFIMAAERGGMAAVAETPYFADCIAKNPSNRERLLAQDPEAFIATMKRWNSAFFYDPNAVMAGARNEDLRKITQPALIFEGNDDIHPASVSQAMAQLMPNATLVPSPWSGTEFMDKFSGRTGGSVFDLYPQLVPAIFAFIERHAR